MTCYTDFFIHYCPNCGKRLETDQEHDQIPHKDYLEGKTIVCSCGVKCHYLPEHTFPYVEGADPSALA